MKLLIPLLALSTTTLSAPTRNDVTVKYTANYPGPPAAVHERDAPAQDALEEDVPSPTNVADPSLLSSDADLDEILSIEKPLPSSFLMAVPELRAKRLREAEAEAREGEGDDSGEGEAPAAESSRPAPQARDVDQASVDWVADMRHTCPFAALMAISVVALLACAVQRWRKPRGEIYLHVEKPQRSLSLRAEEMASSE